MDVRLKWTLPVITSYPDIANLMSILNSYPNTNPWISMNFYQLAFREKKYGTFLDALRTGNDISVYQKCPYLYFNKLCKNTIKELYKSFLDFISETINKEFYVLLDLNIKYIKRWNEKDDLMHETLIYGYNKCNNRVYIADFFGGRYSNTICTIEEIELAFINSLEDNVFFRKQGNNILSRYSPNDIFIVKIDSRNENIKIDLELIRMKLADFINGKDSFNVIRESCVHRDLEYNYGYLYYKKFANELVSYNFDLRKAHVLYDHKKILLYNMKTLYENKLISETFYTEIFKIIESMINESLILRNRFLKILFLQNERNISKMLVELVAGYEKLEKDDISLHKKLLYHI